MHRSIRPPDDDATLLARSFGRFYERHEAAVLGFFARRTGRAELAADLTGETFARALAGRDRFDASAGSARAWLFGIARHLLADSIRERQVQDSARRRLGMVPIALDDDDLLRIDELARDDALAALDELPADQRDAVRGHVVEERGYEELASELRCSPGVVRQRVSRGLRTLRRRLGEQP
jgi:RNA polymerase sigma factor (sigma-70 family)